ncbi:hypothetical protein B7494_g4459 [Chlorociboria aeruginascens]|nr:hypothetical protein B7494_g4459 [Chlorociboria aeruginascens]
MAPTLSQDEIEDLLYFARTGDKEEYTKLKEEVCAREGFNALELLKLVRDGDSGNGVLHMCAANGYHELVHEICVSLYDSTPKNPRLLEILNSQNIAGNTALHWAALNGHLETVKVLVKEGADPTVINARGHDAVFEAELNDKTGVVEWLLNDGGEGLMGGVAGVVDGDVLGDVEVNGEEGEGKVEGEGGLDGDRAGKLENGMAGLRVKDDGD